MLSTIDDMSTDYDQRPIQMFIKLPCDQKTEKTGNLGGKSEASFLKPSDNETDVVLQKLTELESKFDDFGQQMVASLDSLEKKIDDVEQQLRVSFGSLE